MLEFLIPCIVHARVFLTLTPACSSFSLHEKTRACTDARNFELKVNTKTVDLFKTINILLYMYKGYSLANNISQNMNKNPSESEKAENVEIAKDYRYFWEFLNYCNPEVSILIAIENSNELSPFFPNILRNFPSFPFKLKKYIGMMRINKFQSNDFPCFDNYAQIQQEISEIIEELGVI